MWNARLDGAQVGITSTSLPGEISITSDIADDTTLIAESEKELKSLLMKVKEESEKAGLKLNIQKMQIMASGPITSWQIDGETMETVMDFILGAPKSLQMVTAAMKLKNAYSWKKSYNQATQHIKKQRYYFGNKGPSSQSYGFSSSHVWTWELDREESWALKNWCFWAVVLEKTRESLGLQGDPTSPFWRRSVLGVLWKEWC